MIDVALEPRLARPLAALTFLAACVWLLARPEMRALGNGAVAFAIGYTAIWAGVVVAPTPVATEPAALPRTTVLVVGVGSVLLAGRIAGSAVPVTMSSVALPLNLLAAVAEEALFRRLAFGWLRRYGVAVAVVATAAAFALLHVPAYGFEVLPVDLGAGLLLSWQRAASGTWSVPAATHAAANLLAVVR
jgi:membrane protease YdiL (CAAX protease family)